VQWQDAWSVGVEEIDLQHARLIVLLDQLTAVVRSKRNTAAQAAALEELRDDVRQHIATEQNYFDRFDYVDIARHVREHERFMRTVDALANRLAIGRTPLSEVEVSDLGRWLANHLVATDKLYFEFLREQGWV
jgi:hemerythrin-like metal-binding protein